MGGVQLPLLIFRVIRAVVSFFLTGASEHIGASDTRVGGSVGAFKEGKEKEKKKEKVLGCVISVRN